MEATGEVTGMVRIRKQTRFFHRILHGLAIMWDRVFSESRSFMKDGRLQNLEQWRAYAGIPVMPRHRKVSGDYSLGLKRSLGNLLPERQVGLRSYGDIGGENPGVASSFNVPNIPANLRGHSGCPTRLRIQLIFIRILNQHQFLQYVVGFPGER